VEHRYSQRTATHIPVAIILEDQWVARGMVTNMGNGGVFVRSRLPRLRADQPLRLRLLPTQATRRIPDTQFDVLVTHVHPEGFGAWLGEGSFDEDTRIDSLARYLSSPASEPAPEVEVRAG
jgi:hypothetical protein